MSEKPIPQWLNDPGWKVEGLIRQYRAMLRFRDMVLRWHKDYVADLARCQQWGMDRHNHFFEKAVADPRLTDKAAGPPAEGFVFETQTMLQRPAVKVVGAVREWADVFRSVSAWIPPELQSGTEPRWCLPLPLSNDHVLTLPEMYAVLSAVHDVVCKGVERIDPWNGSLAWRESVAHVTYDDHRFQSAKLDAPYFAMVQWLTTYLLPLSDAALPALLTFLNAVQDDLIAAAGTGGGSAGGDSPGEAVPVEDDAMLSPAQLAEKFQVPQDSLRKALERGCRGNSRDFVTVADRAPNQPEFLYRLGAARPIAEKLQKKQTR